ncbi:meiotic nuclear division protein 1 homolog isoform X2 [Syzygium oleosum]|uniref:meiotic nuclear division protein 1 homolog isoform X2 n=1 Tax=Syzygium oleosum TaxID=219896 RepID=UPI0024B9FEB6|nr:meiotic nuclear division protein 1 homolog isoform X2 [Syzygium oleosum]XP_056177078.1 meiotic nuclear division protein 1 homolog isoform X2 [Syzygium oleosum]
MLFRAWLMMTSSPRTRLELRCISGVFLAVPETRVTKSQLRNVYRKLESDVQSSKRRLTELTDQCNALKKGREESDEREEALSNLKKVEEKYNELKDEMAEYADNDPAAFEAMKNAILVAHAAANRWTDNIFTLRQWCSNNFPEAKEQLEHMYQEVGITDDLDYLEMSTPGN